MGTQTLGPDNHKLLVRTYREGAAAKLGHDLVFEVTSWQATVEVGDDGAPTSAELTADSSSLSVIEGTGGAKALSDKDKGDIKGSIDKKVLKGCAISFRSTDIKGSSIRGDLELGGNTKPLTFLLDVDDSGNASAKAQLTQSDWGIKPYSAMMGALKVRDTVDVELSAR